MILEISGFPVEFRDIFNLDPGSTFKFFLKCKEKFAGSGSSSESGKSLFENTFKLLAKSGLNEKHKMQNEVAKHSVSKQQENSNPISNFC